jgi:hypothetical protein
MATARTGKMMLPFRPTEALPGKALTSSIVLGNCDSLHDFSRYWNDGFETIEGMLITRRRVFWLVQQYVSRRASVHGSRVNMRGQVGLLCIIRSWGRYALGAVRGES